MNELLEYLITHEEQFRRSRLAALYSDFRRLRTLNPDGYAANVAAWRKGLTNAAKAGHITSRGSSGDSLLLKLDEELLRALEHPEWGRPLALGTVIQDAMAKKEIIPITDYLAGNDSVYHKYWAATPWYIFSWGLQQLGLVSGQNGENKLPDGEYVLLSNVDEAAKIVAQRISGYTSRLERIYSKQLFYQEFAGIFGNNNHLSHKDLNILLIYVSRGKGIAAYDGQTIKFRGSSEAFPSAITSEDTTIASLKTLMTELEAQIDVLIARVDGLNITARNAVSRKNRVSALAALRSKRLNETNLQRQSATLGQLQDVYSKIAQASDQVDLIRIMEGSTGVLRALNAEAGGVERVDDVVDQLREQMIQVDEIGNVMAEVGQGVTIIDDSEVDDELEALEREDRERKDLIDQKVIEAKGFREAEETKSRLEELEAVELHTTKEQQQEAPRALEPHNSPGKCLEEDITGLARISLDETKSAQPVV